MFGCFFGHNWDNWRQTETLKIVGKKDRFNNTESWRGIALIQERICLRCNKKVLDKQEIIL